MANGFDISSFKSVLEGNKELIQPNKFMVTFAPPKKLQLDTETCTYMCKATQLPGLGIEANSVYRYGYGPNERFPQGTLVNDLIMQFYVDGSNTIRSNFVRWTRFITGADSRSGFVSKFPDGSSPYEFAYKDDFVADIAITVFNNQGEPVIRTVLIDAWPNYVSDVGLDWQDKNNVLILPVAFTYRDWYEESVPL